MKKITAFLIAFLMIFTIIPVSAASGYCYNCEKTYSYSVEYEESGSTYHCVRHWCYNCGEDQYQGTNYEPHTMSNGVCTKCGYDDGSGSGGGGSDYCSHRYTSLTWNGCRWKKYCDDCGEYLGSGYEHTERTRWNACYWEKYCRDCGEVFDYGYEHGSYSYGSWEYYSSTRHRRIYACDICGEGSYEYDYHSSSTSYAQLNSTQHSVTAVCSDCGATLTETTANHSFSYGSWSNYSDSQHRRTKTCTNCGYSDYDYSSHSLSYGSWQNYSDSQHRRTKVCANCDYGGYNYASHSFTYGTWTSISENDHQRTKTCSCGYSSTEKAAHKDNNNDGKCDDCGEILGLTVEWNASANGGTIGGFSGQATKVKTGSIAKAPLLTPVKEGHDFTGWFTEISGGELYSTIPITTETTFYAQFEPTTYIVNWDTQNFEMIKTLQVYGEVLIFPEEPKRDGYTFSGWYTEAVGGKRLEKDTIYNTAGNSMYYAHWDENPEIFSVTVPAMLVLTMSEQGKVYSAKNAEIVNNSTDAVKVKSVSLSAENGWSIVPFSNNMSAEKVDANVIGFSLNNVRTSVKGNRETLSILNDWRIGKGSALSLTYDAVVSAVSQSVNKQVLTVVFVIDWDR